MEKRNFEQMSPNDKEGFIDHMSEHVTEASKFYFQLEHKEYTQLIEKVESMLNKINPEDISGLEEKVLQVCWDLVNLGNTDIPYKFVVDFFKYSFSQSDISNWFYFRPHFK